MARHIAGAQWEDDLVILKKFTESLMWGAGFTSSFIVLCYLAAYFLAPTTSQSQPQRTNDSLIISLELMNNT